MSDSDPIDSVINEEPPWKPWNWPTALAMVVKYICGAIMFIALADCLSNGKILPW